MALNFINASVAWPDLSQPSFLSTTSKLQEAIAFPEFLSSWPIWKYVVTFILGLVVYDQGRTGPPCRYLGPRECC